MEEIAHVGGRDGATKERLGALVGAVSRVALGNRSDLNLAGRVSRLCGGPACDVGLHQLHQLGADLRTLLEGPHGSGCKNYETFLTDHVYWHSVFNTIYYAVGSVAVVNLVALPMALLLNQKLRGLNIFRTIFYMPAILPAVAVVLVFRLILFPGTGVVSWFLTKFGAQCDTRQVTCNPVDWLNNPRLTMPAVILISAWGVGQTLLIYLAGLQGIDKGLYEAGAVDGATGWSKFRYITLPLLTPAIFFNVVTGLIGAFQEFTKLVIFAGGAAATGGPRQSLLTTFWYVYVEGFDYFHMGLATAMAFGLFVLILIFTATELSPAKSGGCSTRRTVADEHRARVHRTSPGDSTSSDAVPKPPRRREGCLRVAPAPSWRPTSSSCSSRSSRCSRCTGWSRTRSAPPLTQGQPSPCCPNSRGSGPTTRPCGTTCRTR